MSTDTIQTTFSAGELSPRLWGQTDLEKYSQAVEQARNWVVEYRGGISTRPGLEFKSYLTDAVRVVPFKFSPDLANTYQVIFGDGIVRFAQEGEYVLEDPVEVVGVSNANPAVVTTATPHGYVSGDWVQIEGVGGVASVNSQRTFTITVLSNLTFSLRDPVHGTDFSTAVDPTYTGGGTVSRVYTLPSPYHEVDLPHIQTTQLRDTLRIVCGETEQPIRDLIRHSHTSWEFKEVSFGSELSPPSGLHVTSQQGSGTAETIFAVTAVDAEGQESLVSEYLFATGLADYTSTAGSVSIAWDSVAGAEFYRVYRGAVSQEAKSLTYGDQLGYIGRTFSTTFTDNNIVPDYTRAPSRHSNPFAAGAVQRVVITNGGSGYKRGDTVTVTDANGAEFRGYPIVDESAAGNGKITGVFIVNPGKGYTPSASVAFGSATGSGATATVEVGPSTGTYPSTATTFQQRMVYAAQPSHPLRVLASSVGQFNNFDTRQVVTEAGPWDYTLDSESVTPIRSVLELRGGLLVFARSGVWKITGGRTRAAVTPTNALAEPQSYIGIANLPPITIDTDVLYLQSGEDVVRLLAYNNFSRLYAGTDVSILSSHLITPHNPLVGWAGAVSPFRLVWAVRRDGTFLSFTIVPEQKVFGWTPHCTNGKVLQVVGVAEQNVDQVYFVVERLVREKRVKFLERLADRTTFTTAEDSFCVDSGVALKGTSPSAGISFEAEGEGWKVTATTPVFSSADVGKVLRAGGGKFEVTSVLSTTQVVVKVLREAQARNCVTHVPFPVGDGEWTLDIPTSEVGGLWHLEGEEVSILGDGNVMPKQRVVGGKVTLPHPVTRCVVGLAYECVLRPLPPAFGGDVIEGKRRLMIDVAVRRLQTRGLETGQTLSNLYEMKERTTEDWGEPIVLQNSTDRVLSTGVWGMDVMPYIVQRNPLPATILGLIHSIEVGDADR